MNQIDWDIEMNNHLKYYMALINEQNTCGEEIEEKTAEILKKKESDNVLDIEDFYFLEERAFSNNIIQADILKTVSRIRLLYQMSVGFKITFTLSEAENNVLNKLVKEDSYDFVYFVSQAGLEFKDADMKERVRVMCMSSIEESSLEKRYEMLKSQYEFFLNNIKENGKEGERE